MANRLLSRGYNFTPTPAVQSDRQLGKDLKRLEFGIYGRLLGHLIQNKEPGERSDNTYQIHNVKHQPATSI